MKKGDSIVCVVDGSRFNLHGITKGRQYEVVEVRGNGMVVVVDDNGNESQYKPERFRLVDGSAVKHDGDKADLTLVSFHAACAIARAMMYGEAKYGRDNYRQPPRLSRERLIAAAIRHLLQSQIPGKELDDESGLPHTYHAAAALAMLHDGEEVT